MVTILAVQDTVARPLDLIACCISGRLEGRWGFYSATYCCWSPVHQLHDRVHPFWYLCVRSRGRDLTGGRPGGPLRASRVDVIISYVFVMCVPLALVCLPFLPSWVYRIALPFKHGDIGRRAWSPRSSCTLPVSAKYNVFTRPDPLSCRTRNTVRLIYQR